jgi:hypothetical protein
MRKHVFATLVILAASASAAQAYDGVPYYPWCAINDYTRGHSGRSCGFVSYEQCRFSIRGDLSARCVENTWQSPNSAATSKRKRG